MPTSSGTAPAPDGRIFQTARGGILQDSGYNEVWDQARQTALTPAQYRSPLGRRPYDLRHAALSLWLNAGAAPAQIAQRAGHSITMLLAVYTHCIDGQDSTPRSPANVSAAQSTLYGQPPASRGAARMTRIWPTYGPQRPASGLRNRSFSALEPLTQLGVNGSDLGLCVAGVGFEPT